MSCCIQVESCCCTDPRSSPLSEDAKASYHRESNFVNATIYEAEDQSDEDVVSSSSICNLPHEVWSLIMNYVPQEDRLQHRVVSKAWSNLVDECSTFKICYNTVPPELMKHVLGLRIRGCEFSGIKDDVQPFAHPLLVRDITLGACMTATNTKTILSSCRNVEFLRYFATEKSDTAFCSSINHEEYLKNLRRLKSIEIGILFFGRRNSTLPSSSINTLLGNPNIVYCALTELQIHFKLTRLEWIAVSSFVSRHAKTLRKFGLYRQCICEEDDSTTTLEESNVLESLKVFSECKLESLVVVRGANYKCGCAGELLWSNVLGDQCNILTLNTDLQPTIQVIEGFVAKNQNSLSNLRLHDVSLGVDAHMDFSIFQNCKNLQSLSLSFLSSAIIILKVYPADNALYNCKPFHERYLECSGLQFLPKSLKKLSIKGCDILSSTLLEMSRELIYLTELHLGDQGGAPSRPEYGVTVPVLVSIIQNMPDLKYLTIDCNFLTFSAKQKARFIRLIKEIGILSDSGNEGMGIFGPAQGSLITLDPTLFTGNRTELAKRIISELQL